MLIFAGGGKPENPEKNPRRKVKYQRQTQLTYEAERLAAMPPMLSYLFLLHLHHEFKASADTNTSIINLLISFYV
jgi:hypothetical protein